MTDILLITEQSIKNITNISDNMAGKLLLTAIRESQEINLREILGDALLDELKRQVAENDVRETYNQLILQCQYFLAYQSCANICMITSVKIDNAGLQRVSDEKMEPLPVSEVNQIHDYYQQKADFYCERLQNFLLQHKEDYPQLTTRQCNSINANLYSSASCGIFLGGPRSKGTQRDCDGMNSSKSQGVEVLDVELTENGTYDYTPKGYGYNKAHIVVNTPEIKNQEKTITITENGVSVVVPDSEYTGIGKIDIKVDAHPTERLERTYTENGTYEIEGEYKSGEITVNTLGPESVIAHMNKKPYADETGLAALGWDEESINNYKYNNLLYEWENNSEIVSDKNIALKDVIVDYASIEENKNNPDFVYCPMIDNLNAFGFYECKYLKGIPKIDTSRQTDFITTFYNCKNLKTIPLIDTSNATLFGRSSESFYVNNGMFAYSGIETIPKLNTSKGTSFNSMFQNCMNLKTIPLIDTSNAVDMRYMFRSCEDLQYIPQLDTSKNKYFNGMFYYCKMLKSIPPLNSINGVNFSNMFNYCEDLVVPPKLNTANGKDFSQMFYHCDSLTGDIELDTSNAVYCYDMFHYTGLTNIRLTSTSKCSKFDYMFRYCRQVKTISTLDITLASSIRQMFEYCHSLVDVVFEGSINTSIFFIDCTELSFDSIKSILTACSKTTNSNSKTVSFNRTIQDQNQELTNLVASCTEKGWQVTGLNITTE